MAIKYYIIGPLADFAPSGARELGGLAKVFGSWGGVASLGVSDGELRTNILPIIGIMLDIIFW